MADFRFVESDHSYWLGERRLPSVTGILEDTGLANYKWSTDYHKERGGFVHKATELIDRGTLDWSSLDPVLVPYCEAYAKFCSSVNMETLIISEKPLYHPQHLYAGTPDRLVTMNSLTTLIDIKSGATHPATALQVAGYWDLVRVNLKIHISKAFVLYLRDDGTFRLTEVKDLRRNLQVFLTALSLVRGSLIVEQWKEENL